MAVTARVVAILTVVVVLNLPWKPSGAVLKDYRFLSKNITSTLDQLLNRSRYDKRIRPDFGGKSLLLILWGIRPDVGGKSLLLILWGIRPDFGGKSFLLILWGNFRLSLKNHDYSVLVYLQISICSLNQF
jgi:hypothetical protein